MAQWVKNLPTMQEMWVRSLGWKDPLEEEMATHSSILAWEILWTEEPGGLESKGLQSWTQLRTCWTGQDSTGAEALSWENHRRGPAMKSYRNHRVPRQGLEQELNFSPCLQDPT